MGLRIFISYAHADTTPLVERIIGDLCAAGHDPWRDCEKIRFTDDWRRKILEGLKDSDLVLVFLSPKAIREGGVCLDEIAIALRVCHGRIATILAAPEADTPVPPSIGYIQWLDMHDWADRWTDPAWYGPRLKNLLDHLNSPARHGFKGEIESLEAWLTPVPQTSDIGPLIEGFTGREWLADRINHWRRNETDRTFWLTGAPGTGKSAFAAWITHYGRANVAGINLCKFGNEDRTDARKVIRTLAFLVATRLPDYRHELLRIRGIYDPHGTEIAAKSAPALFDFLLTEPLATIDGGRRHDRFLLVIDGLDETIPGGGESILARVLGNEAGRLPRWMAVLATSRPEFPGAVYFSGVAPLRLDAGTNAGDHGADIGAYVRGWPMAAGREARIIAAADGNFRYLHVLRQEVEAGHFDLDRPQGLPRGLAALYFDFFRRQFPSDADYEPFVSLMELLAAAERPVPLALLRRIVPGWDTNLRAETRVLRGLGSLFERRDDGLAPFHGSVRDFLADSAQSDAFVVDAGNGHRRLATALWSTFLAAPEGTDLDPYVLGELPAQVQALARLGDDNSLRALLDQGAPWFRLSAIAEGRRAAYAWEDSIAWFGLIAALGAVADDTGLDWRRLALVEEGDDLMLLGQTDAALAAFRASETVCTTLTARDPANTQWQRDLYVSNVKIGDVLLSQGDGPGALLAFRRGLEIAETLAARDPANTQLQRDLYVSNVMIGDVLLSQGDGPGALLAFRRGLEIAETLAAGNPANTQLQRDLSISHNRIGDVLLSQGDGPGALLAFRRGLEIAETLTSRDPANTEWQRDLSISHEKIGDVLVSQGDGPGALLAFRRGLGIRETLAARDPANTLWQRDLSVSHDRIGDVLLSQGDGPGALLAFRRGLEIAETLAARDPANTLWQRDLSVSHEKIGDVLLSQGDGAGALLAFRRGLAIVETLAARDPANTPWQRDLSVSLARVAERLLALGQKTEARVLAERALTVRRAAIARAPGDPMLPGGVPYYEELLRRAGGAP